MTPRVVIHTDGACSGNPGPGGWGAVLHHGRNEKELWGGELATTNNRMELMAAIQALEALTKPCRVELHTDSQYVQKGIKEWIYGWKSRCWKTAEGRAAYGRSMAAIRPKMEGLRDGFTQKEFRDALPFLKALRTWLDDKPEA